MLQLHFFNIRTYKKEVQSEADKMLERSEINSNMSCCGRQGGLMVSVLNSSTSDPGSSPDRANPVLFLGKTLNSHSTSLHPGV